MPVCAADGVRHAQRGLGALQFMQTLGCSLRSLSERQATVVATPPDRRRVTWHAQLKSAVALRNAHSWPLVGHQRRRADLR
eukprot:5991681-Heterocapsa_arctica.AAC.1